MVSSADQSWPVRPPETLWDVGDPELLEGASDLVAVGMDLEPGTLLAAYRHSLFPMPVRRRTAGWFSPLQRGIIPLGNLRVSRSLRKSCEQYELRVNSSFAEVVRGCADPERDHGWINDDIVDAYQRLHELGWAHSIETWDDGELAGGLYGVAIGGLFAGESMFHRRPDASKVALIGLVDMIADGRGKRLLDTQWLTPHLASLGGVEVSRSKYRRLLREVVDERLPTVLAQPGPMILGAVNWRTENNAVRRGDCIASDVEPASPNL